MFNVSLNDHLHIYLDQMTESLATESDEELPSQAAHAVRALLERHGIPKHRQAAFVGEFFGISRAASHRRTHGTAAWSLEELQAIGEKFGESLPDMLGGGRSSGGTRAMLHVGDLLTPCRIWLAEDGDESGSNTLVAVENMGTYTVVPAAAAGTLPTLRVSRVEIDQSLDKPPRIAVLDDDRSVTKSICAGLVELGYQALPYNTIEALMAETKRAPFDAYILDWKLRGGLTAMPLIAMIREETKHGAIALVSGKFRETTINPHEVATASLDYNFRTFEKPAQLEFIVSALARDGLAPARGATAR